MGLNATQVLGSDELAGVKVNPRGLGRAIMARSVGSSAGGGLAGAAIGAVAETVIQKKFAASADRQRAEAASSSAPPFRKLAWLAVTQDELALLELDIRTTLKLTGTVLARVPRAGVAAVDVARSKPMVAAPITVSFTDGQVWVFEIPTFSKGKARALAALLTPAPTTGTS